MNGILFTDQKWKEEVARMKHRTNTGSGHHAAMQRVHGSSPEHKCGECKFLATLHFNHVYHKCSKSKHTNSPTTDWRKKWEACGLFEVKVLEGSK